MIAPGRTAPPRPCQARTNRCPCRRVAAQGVRRCHTRGLDGDRHGDPLPKHHLVALDGDVVALYDDIVAKTSASAGIPAPAGAIGGVVLIPAHAGRLVLVVAAVVVPVRAAAIGATILVVFREHLLVIVVVWTIELVVVLDATVLQVVLVVVLDAAPGCLGSVAGAP